MSASDNGGPAFPTSVSADSMGGLNYGEGGMTLRDYFAAKAMQALIRVDTDNGRLRGSGEVRFTTVFAYQIADAMLAEREK
jgi:hypothetical protein